MAAEGIKIQLVSSCLAGVECRYCGGHNLVESVRNLVETGTAVVVCPEELGGLPTPRNAAEIVGGTGEDVLAGKARVMDCTGNDVTAQFVAGARKTLELALRYGVNEAILKESSPSCGGKKIYTGDFANRKKPGMGVTAALLKSHGIKVVSEEEL